MRFVFVPVPVEHEDKITAQIMQLSLRAALNNWDAQSITQVFGEADERSRSIISQVAHAMVEGGGICARDLADRAGSSELDIIDLIEEVNRFCQERSRPSLIMTKLESLPDGQVGTRRLLMMGRPFAEFVLQAERLR